MAITASMNGSTTGNSTNTTGDNSDAALCTLHVASNVYNDDWTLHMLCQYIQQTTYQLTIQTINSDKKSTPSDSLYLTIGGGGGGHTAPTTTTATNNSANVIRERNAIVRSLLGIALHGAFDSHHRRTTGNCLWNGGYSMMHISCHSTSVVASLQHVKLLHFMTVASQLRTVSAAATDDTATKTKWISMILEELDHTLQKTSFLLPYSSTPSFVDMDVAVALLLAFVSSLPLSNMDGNDHIESACKNTFSTNVQRWMVQMIHTIQQLSSMTNVPCPYDNHPAKLVVTVMDVIQSFAITKLSSAPLIFFYGTEDTAQALSKLSSVTKKQLPTESSSKTITTKAATNEPAAAAAAASSTSKKMENTGSIDPAVEGGGKKKLTKQDKKAAAAAAKTAAGGGDINNAATDTTTTKKSEATPTTATADVYDVSALDLRIGKIIKIWEHESADKLYCEEIDFGNGEIRQIASGLRPFYKDPNDLLNQMVLVVYNLKKRTLVGFPSHGMVLCASNADHTAVEIVTPPPNATIGERIAFDGLDNTKAAEPESKVAKKKIFETIAPDLVTNDEGYVMWKAHAAQCTAGPIRAINGMSNAHVS